MKRFLSILVLSLVAVSASATDPASVVAARNLFEVQRNAWNRADIDGFMESDWRRPDLRFAGGDTSRDGWRATIDRYRKTYPDAAATSAAER